jgi:molybdopterin-guanine dinucleotide biosynthesis protein A
VRSGSEQEDSSTVADLGRGTKSKFEKIWSYPVFVQRDRPRVTGAVLAGGRGERLGGRSKALLPLGPGGSPAIVRTIAVLEPLTDPILVSARDPEAFAFLGRRVVTDTHFGKGPLAGLEAVLDASPHDLCLVVACDMPFLSRPLLERLIGLSLENAGVAAVVPRTSLGLHPLAAVYRRSLLPEVRARLARGSLALHELVASANALEVAEDELRRYDPSLRSLENVNTPEDLARALRAVDGTT